MAKSKKKKQPVVEDDPATLDIDESLDPESDEGAGDSTDEVAEDAAAEETEVVASPPGHDPDEVLDPEKHVAIHLEGNAHKIMLLSEFKGVRPFSRTLQLNGRILEHTHDHRGVWAYRHLG